MNTSNNVLTPSSENWTEEQWTDFREWLTGMLRVGPVVVTFDKKDGSERVMTCSLNPELLPPAPVKESATPKKENLNNVSVYDLNAEGWRSFIVKNVKKVELVIE